MTGVLQNITSVLQKQRASMDSTNDALCDCIAQLVKVNDIGMEAYVFEFMGSVLAHHASRI